MLTEILTKLFELFEQKYLLLEEEPFIFSEPQSWGSSVKNFTG